jgi:hypothetical protein
MDKNPAIEQSERQILLDKFKQDFKNRSFSGRHVELGKMINCAVCQTRHRSSKVCEAVYVGTVPHTRNGLYGAKSFKGRRHRPHHNRKNLQLLERTRQLFPFYSALEPENAMKAARAQAIREMRQERAVQAKAKRDQQHVSRHINRGLLKGSVRP